MDKSYPVPEELARNALIKAADYGKIMRRILRKIAENVTGSQGDTSTLADPRVVESLVAGRTYAGAG